MYDHILLPTDGHPGSKRSVDVGLSLAATVGASVTALSVVDTGAPPLEIDGESHRIPPDIQRHLETWADQAVDDVELAAMESNVDCDTRRRQGSVVEEILEAIPSDGADLVTMGTRARTETPGYLGSTTQRVLTRSPVPVLAVPPPEETAERERPVWNVDEILVPTDGSDTATTAVNHALGLAAFCDAAVRAIYVVDTSTYNLQDAPRSIVGLLKDGGRSTLESIQAAANERGVEVATSLLRGLPATQVVTQATDGESDLIVMGTRGHGRDATGQDSFLGSTTARVLQRSAVPILCVP